MLFYPSNCRGGIYAARFLGKSSIFGDAQIAFPGPLIETVKSLISRLSGARLFPEAHPRWFDLAPKDRLAARGELLAERVLRRAGYWIRGRRWRGHRFALDLVARGGRGGREEVVAVVEVKTRRDNSFGAPQEAVPAWKQRHIAAAARAYVAAESLDDCVIRFDVVAVTLPPRGRAEIVHIEDAFTA